MNFQVTSTTIADAIEKVLTADVISYSDRVQYIIGILKVACDKYGWKMFRRAPITNKDWEILRIQMGELRIAVKFRTSTSEIELFR